MRYTNDGAPRFTCNAYAGGFPGFELDQVPDAFWRKIEVTFANGRLMVLVYDHDPGGDELPTLMWKLQSANRTNRRSVFSRIVVITADGERTEAPLV